MCLSFSDADPPPHHPTPPPTRIHPSPTAGSITASSSTSTLQGKPSLRRIKGRIHRSKSLDSIDLLDAHVSADMVKPPLCYNSSSLSLPLQGATHTWMEAAIGEVILVSPPPSRDREFKSLHYLCEPLNREKMD